MKVKLHKCQCESQFYQCEVSVQTKILDEGDVGGAKEEDGEREDCVVGGKIEVLSD